MPSDVVFVGYRCPSCGRLVTVLRSTEPPKPGVYEFPSKCECGYARRIDAAQLEQLEVWRGRAPGR